MHISADVNQTFSLVLVGPNAMQRLPQWEHKEFGRKSYWEMKHGEGRRATQNEHSLSTGSAKKLTANSPVMQMWYFLTVAYLLGARTLQI